MIIRSLRHAFFAGCISTAVILPSVEPSFAFTTVYDPWNYSQNLLEAARALQQIENQITSLQNEAQMLTNQARNLQNLPESSLQSIAQSFSQTQMRRWHRVRKTMIRSIWP